MSRSIQQTLKVMMEQKKYKNISTDFYAMLYSAYYGDRYLTDIVSVHARQQVNYTKQINLQAELTVRAHAPDE